MPVCPVHGQQDVAEPSLSPWQASHGVMELSIVLESFMDLVLFSKLYFEKKCTLRLSNKDILCLSVSGDETGLHVHNFEEWTRVKCLCTVLLGIRAALSVKYPSGKMHLHTC